MSETIAAPAAPEAAPAAPVAPEAPAAPAWSAQDVVRGLHLASPPAAPVEASAEPVAPAEPAAPVVDANGRVHGTDGRFVEAPQEGAASAATDGNAPAADAAPGDAPEVSEPTAADAVPEGFVRIELPEDHPLRERGRDHVLAPAEMEEDYRGLVNSPVRRREVEAAQQQVGQLEQSLIQLQASLRAQAEFQQALFSDRRVMDTYWAIESDHGQEAAASWLQGVLAENGRSVEQYVTQAQQQRAAEQHEQAAQGFLADVHSQIPTLYPLWGQAERSRALLAYASYARESGEPLSIQNFRQFADARYVQHPEVQAMLRARLAEQQQQAAAEVQRQQAEAARAQLQAHAARQAEVPMAGVPAIAATGQPAPVATPNAPSAQDLLRGLRIT